MAHTPDFSSIFFIGLCVLLVLASLHCGIGLLFRSRSVKNWRPVEGLLSQFDTFSIDFYARGSRSQVGTGIEAEYSYSYGQGQFTGKYVSVLDFPPRLWTTQYAPLVAGLKDAFEHKQPVKVLINPDKPHQAVLSEQPVSSAVKKSALALLLGGFFIWLSYIQMMDSADWLYGSILGLLIYGLFAMGWLSTAF